MAPATVTVDAASYFWMPGIITGHGMRCKKNGEEVLTSETIEAARSSLVVVVLSKPKRLSGSETKFMRAALGLTQTELAKCMGVARKTVAQWESKSDISIANDYMLRGLVMAKFKLDALPQLERPRLAAPPKRPQRIKLDVPTAA